MWKYKHFTSVSTRVFCVGFYFKRISTKLHCSSLKVTDIKLYRRDKKKTRLGICNTLFMTYDLICIMCSMYGDFRYIFSKQKATHDQDIMIQIACYSSSTTRDSTTRVHVHVWQNPIAQTVVSHHPPNLYTWSPSPTYCGTVTAWWHVILFPSLLCDDTSLRAGENIHVVVMYILHTLFSSFFCLLSVFSLGLTWPSTKRGAVYTIYWVVLQKELCRLSNEVRDLVWKSCLNSQMTKSWKIYFLIKM